MRGYVDCVLAILPFEPATHQRLGGPPCIYVGHPLIERLAELRPNADEARRRRTDPPLVLVLPGSRSSEIRRLLAIFGDAIARVAARFGPMELVLPTMPHLFGDGARGRRRLVACRRASLSNRRRNGRASVSRGRRSAASGTVTLELALAGVPMVAAYRVTRIEEMIANMAGLRARLTSVILANLVIGENVVPEFLQRDCTPQRLADALVPLLSDSPERLRQIDAFGRLDQIMALESAPSAKAAAIVLDIARSGRLDLAAAAHKS